MLRQTYAVTFAIGAALAGAAGSLLSVSVSRIAVVWALVFSKAFVDLHSRRRGSVPGAAVGGLIFGLLESFGATAFGSEYALTLAFVVLIVLLLVRPHGLLGVKGY